MNSAGIDPAFATAIRVESEARKTLLKAKKNLASVERRGVESAIAAAQLQLAEAEAGHAFYKDMVEGFKRQLHSPPSPPPPVANRQYKAPLTFLVSVVQLQSSSSFATLSLH